MNKEKFTHVSRHGTSFQAGRCDFQSGINVVMPQGISLENLMSDVSEMIGYHTVNIYPKLNGFSGYDCIVYKFVSA